MEKRSKKLLGIRIFNIGIFSGLVSAVLTGGASIYAKIGQVAIPAAIAIALCGGGYLYVHEINVALLAARAAATQLQQELAAVTGANSANLKTIDALRAQQMQSEAARMSMDTRDRIAASSAASIQTLIDRDSMICPTVATAGAAAVVAGADGSIAPVLRDTLAALAAAQSPPGASR